ncbi:Predicted dioxygenase [Geminocystis sp. NIES-3708]|uniref:Uma2 family endonuclease n=1 Tax=Geminocystis sp. NIES-3708 TaxID=1615909 RepID=UPI0005FC7E5D|nr:Uma2 family endonuclease [Geminocystis sp. NIES-3708]BAQ60003.1 Predicted dioxygenase [Geminocystis sp. NIES-3708]
MLITETPSTNNENFLSLRLLTIREYNLMAEVGILTHDEKVELINGQIITMSPQGSFHAAAITRTNRLLNNQLNKILIRLQLPIIVNDFSEPEPDIAIVKYDPFDYDDRHPLATEVYLIIEIADTTLKTDLEIKRQLYASANIPEYWVLDLKQRQLYVYRESNSQDYQTTIILSDQESIIPLNFPETEIKVSEMLRPLNT